MIANKHDHKQAPTPQQYQTQGGYLAPTIIEVNMVNELG